MMSTIRLRATQGLTLPRFARLGAFIVMLFDAFAEAQRQARAAHERYPFVE